MKEIHSLNYTAKIINEHLLTREPVVFDIYGPGVSSPGGTPRATAETPTRVHQFIHLLQAAFDEGARQERARHVSPAELEAEFMKGINNAR